MFVIHPQLVQDCVVIGDLELSRLLLMNDRQYPWCILVPRVDSICEIHQLDEAQRQQLWRESDLLSRVLVQLFKPDKLNIAALGNVVPQLHVHHIVRYQHDAAWPAPVWGKLPPQPYSAQMLGEILDKLHTGLPHTLFTPFAEQG